MKIGFIDNHKAHNHKAWSGTYKSILDEVRKRHTVEVLYGKLNFFEKEYFFEQRNFYRWVRKQNFARDFLKDFSKLTSRKLDHLLRNKTFDVLIAPAANQRFAYAKTNIPIISIMDATFKSLHGYYRDFSNIPQFNYKQGIEIDHMAFNKAAHILCASDWAKKNAINTYNLPPHKLSVNPFGANLEHVPTPQEIKWDRTDTCRLVFLGVNWIRKGGDIAVAALKHLHSKGLKAALTIVGCVPPPAAIEGVANITVIPFLDKGNPEQEKELKELLVHSDFLLLPTRAEAAGIVFCEASAFGLPIISTNTGGVSSYVLEGVNGQLLPEEATGEAYGATIINAYSQVAHYAAMRQNARRLFEEKLNWQKWGAQFDAVAEQVVACHSNK